MLNKKLWNKIAMIIEVQSITFKPSIKIKKILFSRIELSKLNKEIRIKYVNAFDKKYVWIPNIKIPTKHLKNPKYWAPLNPKEVLRRTANGKPYFWEGLPIKLERKYTNI